MSIMTVNPHLEQYAETKGFSLSGESRQNLQPVYDRVQRIPASPMGETYSFSRAEKRDLFPEEITILKSDGTVVMAKVVCSLAIPREWSYVSSNKQLRLYVLAEGESVERQVRINPDSSVIVRPPTR